MNDYMIRITAADARIRGFIATTRDTVEYARSIHESSPVVTAALGRLLTAGAMMGSMMKGEKDLLTLQIKGDGPVKGITVTADANGNVKGYPIISNVMLHANEKGKLDVAKAIGRGHLTVIKDMGLKEPYAGQIPLQTGEIADDLTYYYASSEQVPSSVGLGVLLSLDNQVIHAGGFIIQLMPFALEEDILNLEQNLSKIHSVTGLLEEVETPEKVAEVLFAGMSYEITSKDPIRYRCDCSRERVSKAVMSIGNQELEEIIQEDKEIEINCQFCNTNYVFSIEEVKHLYAIAKGEDES